MPTPIRCIILHPLITSQRGIILNPLDLEGFNSVQDYIERPIHILSFQENHSFYAEKVKLVLYLKYPPKMCKH